MISLAGVKNVTELASGLSKFKTLVAYAKVLLKTFPVLTAGPCGAPSGWNKFGYQSASRGAMHVDKFVGHVTAPACHWYHPWYCINTVGSATVR